MPINIFLLLLMVFMDKPLMHLSKTHLDPFLFLSVRCGGIAAPHRECFQQPAMRFSMDKAGRDDAGMALNNLSATNKGTIFWQNGIFQLSGRCSLCSRFRSCGPRV